jgi:hypothetical protein
VPRDDENYRRLLEFYQSRVSDYDDVPGDFQERWRQWCRHVLTFGGELVVPPMCPEPDLDELLTDARSWGPTARLQLGEEVSCQENVAVLWIDGTAAEVGTGYALSEDGLWRQHSWGIAGDGVVIETTEERLRYVGVRLVGTGALKFAASNAKDHLEEVLASGGARADELTGLLREARAGLSGRRSPS